MFFNK